ncbi:hypothetical protein HanRHA438_Chr02g0089651 [Helianthus annuus]|nr:hypothetical protein HanRHA438_Chr02g0089651 [Helianthus annuus]
MKFQFVINYRPINSSNLYSWYQKFAFFLHNYYINHIFIFNPTSISMMIDLKKDSITP